VAPRDRDILNMYGVACMNRFEVEAAAASFAAAVEAAPNDVAALLNLELLSMRSLRNRQSLERSPKIAVARSQAVNRLRALHRRGQLDDAGMRHLLMLAGSKETFVPLSNLPVRSLNAPNSAANCRPTLNIFS